MEQQLKVALVAIAILSGWWFIRTLRGASLRRYPLPPGPRGIPLLGNLLQLPGQHLATYFRNLCEEYGGLVSLNLAGLPVILLGNMEVAKELLDKRSAKFSERPVLPYLDCIDPEKINWTIASGNNTNTFIGRKLTAGIMAGVRAGKTEWLQHFETLTSVNRLLDDRGERWFHEMHRASASMVLSSTFGLHCPTAEEPELKELVGSITELVGLLTPSATIINALPFLDMIPGPMPWRKRAAAFRQRADILYEKLFNYALVGKGSGMNTWAAAFASKGKPEGDQRQLLNTLSDAAFETTAAALQTLVLACICYPQWIRRAQADIDAVVGQERIPTFKDRPQLPYIEAVVRETLRWRPAVRFGIPHQCTADDIVKYQGKEYLIRKGTVVFAVTWAIEHDSKYENPDEFRPERFLDESGQLKAGYETSAFGFGRRVCPGTPFAERSLWINVAMMLWTFDIRKADKPDSATGLPVHYGDTDDRFRGDFTNPPLPFPAVFEPRSVKREELMRQEWADFDKELNFLLPQRRE